MDEVAKPQNFKKLEQPATALATAITDGVLDALTAERREHAIGELTDTYVDQFTRAAATALDVELGPAIQRQIRASVRGVIDEALAEPARAAVADTAARVTAATLHAIGVSIRTDIGPGIAAAIREAGPAVRAMLEQELGPALRAVLEHDLAPAMANTLNTITPALAHAVEESSQSAVRGAVKGLDEAWGPGIARHTADLERALANGRSDLVGVVQLALVGGLGLLLGFAVIAFVWLHVRAREQANALGGVLDEIRGLEYEGEHQHAIAVLKTNIQKNSRAGRVLSERLK